MKSQLAAIVLCVIMFAQFQQKATGRVISNPKIESYYETLRQLKSMSDFDADDDDTISLEEFLDTLEDLFDFDDLADLEDLFESSDKDGDNYLDELEFEDAPWFEN